MKKPAIIYSLIFAVLKITNFIDWSWWYVLMPMIIYASIVFLILSLKIYLSFLRRRRA